MREHSYENLVLGALGEAIRKAVQDVIADHVGSGIDTDIKDAIRERAKRMLNEDEELQRRIRDQLMHWIAQQ